MENEVKKMYVKLSENQMCNKLVDFYDAVAKEIGCEDTTAITYDCRRINVAKNVQDSIIEAYKKKNPKAFIDCPQDAMKQVMTNLVIGGPKVNEELEDNTVEIMDGFICSNI